MTSPNFNGLRVLLLESRRSREMASLVTTYGGHPIEAPSMREVPLETNTEALAFADALMRREFDLVLLLTEWDDYRTLDPVSFGAVVDHRRMLDGRNALDPVRWRAAGWTYRALGRP